MIATARWRRLTGRGAGADPRVAEGETQAWRSWSPDAWLRPLDRTRVTATPGRTPFGAELALFHDCPLAEIGLSQIDRDRPDEAPHAVAVSAGRFRGTYLSLVVDLPPDKARVLDEGDIVCLHVRLGDGPGPSIMTRLNLRTGPNVIAVTRSPRANGNGHVAEFDLGRSGLGGRRVCAVWIDLIFAAPLGEIRIDDLAVTRHRRAAF